VSQRAAARGRTPFIHRHVMGTLSRAARVGALATLVTAMPCLVPSAVAADDGASTVHPAIWPSPKWPLAPDPAIEQRVRELLQKMTLEEKVGQVVQADIASVKPEDARTYHLGSILNGGSSGPNGDDLAPAAKWLELADAFYAASVDKSGGRI